MSIEINYSRGKLKVIRNLESKIFKLNNIELTIQIGSIMHDHYTAQSIEHLNLFFTPKLNIIYYNIIDII